MRRGPLRTFVRDLDILYQVGTVGGLADRELLGHFTTRDNVAAQQAFEAIVHRHGPMVLEVCHRVLSDEHTAEDAFLVLALKADAIRERDSLGPWLHGVAARISRRAKALSRSLRARLTRRGFAPSAGLVGAMLLSENAAGAVPALLAERSAKTALGVLLGQSEILASSASSVALARGVLRAMLFGKVQATAAVLLALATFATALAQTAVGPKGRGQLQRVERSQTSQFQTVASVKVPRTSQPKLPEHARARLGTGCHQSIVRNVAFAPEGRTLASAGWDGAVRFWDLATGDPAANLPTIKEPGPWRGAIAESLAYSLRRYHAQDRPYSGLRSSGTSRGKERFRMRVHKGRLYGLAFAPDGGTFATASDENVIVRIWYVAEWARSGGRFPSVTRKTGAPWPFRPMGNASRSAPPWENLVRRSSASGTSTTT